MAHTILISEIFGPTIQGEGALIGRPTVFVRTGGCDFRCSWCDTLYAVLPEFRGDWRPMEADEILGEVNRLTGGSPILVTLSGGNPALQPLEHLLARGHASGHRFALETQGSIAKPWFSLLDYLVLSPKGPSSGMTSTAGYVAECVAAAGPGVDVSLKIVIFDEADYLFARSLAAIFSEIPLYLQVGTPLAPSGQIFGDAAAARKGVEWLLSRVTADSWHDVTILPQLHVLLWGNKRGV